MPHDFESRLWADHHNELSDAIISFFAKAGDAMRALTDIQFEAPWVRVAAKGTRCAER